MKYRDAIIKYFFLHNVSSHTKERVFRYLADERILEEKDDTMQKIWDDTCHAKLDDDELDIALMQVESNLSLVSGNATKAAGVVMRPRWRIFAASWLIAVMAMSFSAYWYIQTSKKAEQVDQVEFLEAMTDYGQKKNIVLPDGSRVWLNAGSTLIYPTAFVQKTRKVFLSGEGFFEVTKKSSPFVVTTRCLQTKVLGTSFNVKSYVGEDAVTVTLKTGKVVVAVHDRFHDGTHFLVPNEQLVYVPSTGKVVVQQVGDEMSDAWRKSKLQLTDVSLKEALRQIERMYNVKCHLLNGRYAQQRIRAHFNQNEKLENVLYVIKRLIPGIAYRVEGNDIYFE